jgi:hypothetical protein
LSLLAFLVSFLDSSHGELFGRLPTADECEKSLFAILEEQYKSPLLTSSPVLQLLMRLKGKRAQACDKMSMNFC